MRWICHLMFIGFATCGFAEDRKPEPILVAKPDAFRTLVNPNCSHCVDEAKRRKNELKDSDPVLCWTRGYSDGGAIPLRFFLNTYRVISDSYGVFVYDADAGYARGFAPSYNFEFHGWRNGVMVMKDKTDDTIYSCLSGIAVEGKRKGERLKPIPTLVSTWGEVMARNPYAVAYHMFDKYVPSELPQKPNEESVKSRLAKIDPRLKPEELVLGVRIGKETKAFPLKDGSHGVWPVQELGGEKFVIFQYGSGSTLGAYKLVASQPRKWKGPNPDKSGVSPPDAGIPLPDGKDMAAKAIEEFRDSKVGLLAADSTWGVDGRASDGALKGWTLEPVESVVCQWFAWSAEYPDSKMSGEKAVAEPNTVDPRKSIKQIAGTAEFLRLLPKPSGVIKELDATTNTVTLLLDGEKTPKRWNIEADAEIWKDGFWGRLGQFKPADKVWVWLKLDRHKNPISVAMMADEISTQFIRHDPNDKAVKPIPPESEAKRTAQRSYLQNQWREHGLPGSVAFNHVFSGELDVMLDHEAVRWGRSLKPGDAVTLTATADPSIKAIVKSVAPWRERTQLRLVVGELQASELNCNTRVHIKMPALSKELDDSPYPPDLGRTRTTDDRIEWFLCSIYCVCGVDKNTCTGHFYTLASCNPNGCGAPNATRDELRTLIEKGKSDREIWDTLLKDRGPLLLRPHLKP